MTNASRDATTRRNVLLGGAASLLLAGGTMPAASAGTQTRPDIASLAGQKMADLYAKAVAAMQEPAINYPPQPQSWTFQSYIHGVPKNPFNPVNSDGLYYQDGLEERIDQLYGNPAAGTPQADWKRAALDCWAGCEHASPYFITWHRCYLYYFEKICRAMCKDPSFVLPYWNYAADTGPSLQLPEAFRDVKSPLYFDDRGIGSGTPDGSGQQSLSINKGGYMPYPDISYGQTFETNVMFPSAYVFPGKPVPEISTLGFCGRLERLPHNNVHVWIGGWMSNTCSAGGDPIFYVHHCQIDRLAASYEAVNRQAYNWGNDNASPDQDTWDKSQSFFVDETGAIIKVNLAAAASLEPFGYNYDRLIAVSRATLASRAIRMLPGPNPVMLAPMQSQGFQVGNSSVSVNLVADTGGAAKTLGGREPTTLVLEGVKLLQRPPAPLSLFINLPKGAAGELSGPYYVATLSLFNFSPGTGGLMTHGRRGVPHDMTTMNMPASANLQYDVTDILLRQHAARLWDGGAVTVTIAMIGAPPAGDTTYISVAAAALKTEP